MKDTRVPPITEIDDIKRKYDAGLLDSLKADLETFIIRHRGDIAAVRAEEESRGVPFSDEAAIKIYILRHRSINPQKDIQEQLGEIQKETWIRGVQTGCPPNPQEVALDWARVHSAAWRSHRLTTIIYVFERERERYVKLLH
jgi:hypothetical protein